MVVVALDASQLNLEIAISHSLGAFKIRARAILVIVIVFITIRVLKQKLTPPLARAL